MHEDTSIPDELPPSPIWRFTKLLLVSGVLSIILLWVILPPRATVGGLEVGSPAPHIYAMEWVNDPPPKPNELKGKIIVVNAWATWCHNCIREMPELVELEEKYRDRDVQFIGLTNESVQSQEEIERVLGKFGVTWPNGISAVEPLYNFKAELIPAVWVIGPDGKVVWNYDSPGTLDDAIEDALAMVGE
ncbi:MAG: redoxin [Planctomycetaceae bacterium]|nr:redoxin [Planctomycetaceae bacterium]